MKKEAVDKARRRGLKKKFYVTSPAGWMLLELLPRVDMAARLLTELFSNGVISLDKFRKRKNIFYEYLEGLDEWYQDRYEFILNSNGHKECPDYQAYVEYIKKDALIYCNTQVGIDAYHTFVRCDTMSRFLLVGLQFEIISSGAYQSSTDRMFAMMSNFKEDIEGIRTYIWRCRKSSGRSGNSGKNPQTKNS